jgi:amino acid adenylation domain-containing protein
VSTARQQLKKLLERRRNLSVPGITPARETSASRILSYGQQRLWFLHQYLGPNAVYTIPLALRLRGDMNELALVRSLRELHRRHESLRTRLEAHEGGAVQVIDLHELELAVEAVSAADVHTIARSERFYRFDLSRERLCRIRLLREIGPEGAAGDYVLLVTMHHSVSDGWSMGIFFRELVSLYRAYANGEPSPLAPLPIQYADYAQWQRRWLQGEVLESQVSYWREQLKDLPPILTLPTDRPRPSEQTYRGRTERCALPLELTEQLQALSREQGVTLYMTLLSAWAVLLGRYAGQTDVAVGTPIANRTRRETESLIGFFVNMLVMRHDLSGDPRFIDLLKHTRTMALKAYAHQDVPFEQLVEALNPARNTGHSPLFQVSFALQNTPFEAVELPGLAMRPLAGELKENDGESASGHEPEGTARYDMTFTMRESAAGLTGTVEYSTDLFDRGTIRRMLVHYARLLEAIVAAPRSRLSQLSFLSERERSQQLVEWNATARAYPQERCIHELFEAQVEQAPDRIALVHAGSELTYSELNRRANQLAHRLIECGVGPEVRVGICMERSPELVVGLLGILKAGGAYVPLDPEYPEARLEYLLGQSGCRVVLSKQYLLKDVPLLNTMRVLWLDAERHDECFGAYSDANVADSGVGASNLAYVIYTSGSTGHPQGTAIVHRNISRLIFNDFIDYGAARRMLCAASPTFDAFTFELWGALLHGGCSVMASAGRGSAGELGRIVDSQGVECAWLTSSLFNQLIVDSAQSLKRLKRLLVGGEALSIEHVRAGLRQLPQTELIHGYGPAESTTFSCTHAIEQDDLADRVTVPIGRPIGNTQAYVLGPQGELVPTGVVGELYVGGAGLARGYLGEAGLTSERFVPNPFSAEAGERLYRTGDLARWLPHGTLEYLRRVDDQSKVRGYRTELGEIETALLAHEDVRDAAVMVREELLLGYVVAVEGRDGSELIGKLRRHLQQQLPGHRMPSAFVMISSLPRAADGTINRLALPAPEGSAYAQREYEPPQGEIECALAQVWQEFLQVERVGRYDNFFELGGHSLVAVRLMERLRQQGLKTEVRALFSSPTLMQLASTVVREDAVVVPENRITAQCERITPELLPLIALEQEEIDRIVERVPGGVRNVQDIYPLVPLQEGMLFHHLMSADGDAYLIQSLIAFDSRGRLDRFLAAWQSVIDRHDILRTAVQWEGLSQAVQVVWRRAALRVEEVELSSADAARELRERFDSRRYRLDIREAPLQRAFIAWDRPQKRWLLLLLRHHMAIDRTALEVMFDEVRAHLLGEQDQLAAPVPFREFVAQARSGVSAAEHEAFFREMLAEVEEPTAPFGWLDVRGDEGGLAEARLRVEEDVAKGIRRCARAAGVSAASLCHLAWAQVLARLTDREKVVFGTVLFGRLHGGEGAARGVGLFINTLPLKLSIGQQSAQEALRSTHERLGQLLRHEHASLALAQRCSAVVAELPLFTTLLNYRYAMTAAGSKPRRAEGGGIRALFSEDRSNYPLTLSVDDLGEGFGLKVQVRELADPRRICELMHEALAELVEALEAQAATPMRALATRRYLDKTALLSEAQRHRQLVEWNATSRAYPQAQCIHELFEEQVEQAPDRIALVHERSELTYAQLNRRANQVAHYLREQGVGPEVRVGICMERSPEMVIGILGVLKAGGAYVPLDPQYPAARLEYMLTQSDCQAVLSQQQLLADVSLLSAATVLPLDTELRDEFFGAHSDANVAVEDSGVGAGNLAYVIYTSGSTGAPKGVMVKHIERGGTGL